jgi:hypothetical protein
MTTTIYDRENKIVAADTRWSVKVEDSSNNSYLVFVDECGFEKIADRTNATLVMAGDGKLIAEWKKWWFESLDPNVMPSFEIDGSAAIVLLIINKSLNKWIFDIGDKIASICSESEEINAVFGGSGSPYAAESWSEFRCVKSAIISAADKDHFTSKFVKYVDFDKNESNIDSISYDYQDIVRGLIQKGYIMKVQEQNVVPLKGHPLAKEISQMLTSGKAVASAPTPDMDKIHWSDERKKNLVKAIHEVRRLEGIN